MRIIDWVVEDPSRKRDIVKHALDSFNVKLVGPEFFIEPGTELLLATDINIPEHPSGTNMLLEANNPPGPRHVVCMQTCCAEADTNPLCVEVNMLCVCKHVVLK